MLGADPGRHSLLALVVQLVHRRGRAANIVRPVRCVQR